MTHISKTVSYSLLALSLAATSGLAQWSLSSSGPAGPAVQGGIAVGNPAAPGSLPIRGGIVVRNPGDTLTAPTLQALRGASFITVSPTPQAGPGDPVALYVVLADSPLLVGTGTLDANGELRMPTRSGEAFVKLGDIKGE